MDPELEYHLERLTRDYIAQGMTPSEALRRARLDFGGAPQIEEDLRDVRRPRWLADLWMDLAYAVRTFRRTPGFLACAVLTLALGIGANTAIFSLIDAVMLRPLAAPDPSRLIQVGRVLETGSPRVVSYPLFEYFRDRMTTISGMFAQMGIVNTITLDGVDEMLQGDAVSGDYYRVLGLKPAAGRLLTAADDAETAPVAVISYAYWRRRFGLSKSALGRNFRIGATELTIVGVEPPGFEGVERGRIRDFTTPLTVTERISGGNSQWKHAWDFNMLDDMARLKPGVSLERAQAEVEGLFAVWRQEKAAAIGNEFDRHRFQTERAVVFTAIAGLNRLRYRFSAPLQILMTIVALVLLLACANLSGLLLSRAASRQREISVRRALGAGNGRLARQFLAESLLLAALGGIAGVGLAQWFSRVLIAFMANGGDLPLAANPDWRVLTFTAAVSLAACLLAGFAPGWNASRGRLSAGLKQVRGSQNRFLGRALVVAQLALSMTLLIGASLFVRTLLKLYGQETGVRTGGVLTFNVSTKHHFPQERSEAIEKSIVERLSPLPNVVAASAAVMLPLGGGLWTQKISVEGHAFRQGDDQNTSINAIAPRYFAATGTELLAGRDFNNRDTGDSLPVALVNEAFARKFSGGQAPLGRHITMLGRTLEIVGLTQDARYSIREPAQATVYIPWFQQVNSEGKNRSQPTGFSYIVRVAKGDPMSLVRTVDAAIPQIDPALRMYRPHTFGDVLDESTLNERIMATLGAFFGVLALIIACLGIFGILAFQVSRRFRELGVRMALGASRSEVAGLVLGETVRLLLPGCALGVIVALGLTRFVRGMLFQVSPTDPFAYTAAAMCLVAAAIFAAAIPAWRAARIDPVVALRYE
ncbi:MAG TPA: ABC transporter permease [Bryobacteraceae bacterium]|nr:ABC transporter permease [Bryobacteraceae bacterium]